MKKIVLIVALLIAIPVYGIRIIITKDPNNLTIYSIERSFEKTVKQGPETKLAGEKKDLTLITESLTLDLNPKDVLQLFTYEQQRPYTGHFTKTSLGKKFMIDESFDGGEIRIADNNSYQILKKNFQDAMATE